MALPLPGGEGWGEGERTSDFSPCQRAHGATGPTSDGGEGGAVLVRGRKSGAHGVTRPTLYLVKKNRPSLDGG